MKKIKYINDCMNAMWPISPKGFIYCQCDHRLGEGHIEIDRFIKRPTLHFKICQGCKDFDNADEEVT